MLCQCCDLVLVPLEGVREDTDDGNGGVDGQQVTVQVVGDWDAHRRQEWIEGNFEDEVGDELVLDYFLALIGHALEELTGLCFENAESLLFSAVFLQGDKLVGEVLELLDFIGVNGDVGDHNVGEDLLPQVGEGLGRSTQELPEDLHEGDD